MRFQVDGVNLHGFKPWGESNPSNAPQHAPRVCGQHKKVNNDKGLRVPCVAPYGLPKKTP